MATKGKSYSGYVRLSVLLIPVATFLNIIAPGFIRLLLKKNIARTKDFSGQVADLSFSFFKTQIGFKGLDLEIIENKEKLDFLHVDKGTIQLSTLELIKGKVLAKIKVEGLSLTFIKNKTGIHERMNLSMDIPLLITSIKLTDIKLEYIDHSSTPPVKMNCDTINLYGTNITTVPAQKVLPVKIECRGNIYGGELVGNINLNLSQKTPVFDLNLELKDILMPRLNSFFSAYGKFNVNNGLLSFYTEAAARDGAFKGYVKPVITELEIKKDEQHTGPLYVLWQEVLAAITEIFKNHQENQIATKLPVEGTFSKPDINVWYAIIEVLKNAFITALKPSIDNEININSVKE